MPNLIAKRRLGITNRKKEKKFLKNSWELTQIRKLTKLISLTTHQIPRTKVPKI